MQAGGDPLASTPSATTTRGSAGPGFAEAAAFHSDSRSLIDQHPWTINRLNEIPAEPAAQGPGVIARARPLGAPGALGEARRRRTEIALPPGAYLPKRSRR
jgi:hypothetical protein